MKIQVYKIECSKQYYNNYSDYLQESMVNISDKWIECTNEEWNEINQLLKEHHKNISKANNFDRISEYIVIHEPQEKTALMNSFKDIKEQLGEELRLARDKEEKKTKAQEKRKATMERKRKEKERKLLEELKAKESEGLL